jgi:hypothetical protein
MESKGLITKDHISIGKRAITTYKPTEKGIDFCKSILEPYEIMFPRTDIGMKENIAVLLVLA